MIGAAGFVGLARRGSTRREEGFEITSLRSVFDSLRMAWGSLRVVLGSLRLAYGSLR
jgi:hypothetical protein